MVLQLTLDANSKRVFFQIFTNLTKKGCVIKNYQQCLKLKMFRFKNHVMLLFVGGISSYGSFHENFCFSEQKFGALRPSCTTKVSLLLQILHASDEGFTF